MSMRFERTSLHFSRLAALSISPSGEKLSKSPGRLLAHCPAMADRATGAAVYRPKALGFIVIAALV